MAADRARTELLLVGAGHAHLHLIAHAADLHDAGYRITLVAPPRFHYSGAAAAVATGTLPRDAADIDVAALARGAGVTHHQGTVVALDPEARTATCDDGRVLGFDVASINIGSTGAAEMPDAPHGATAVKPLADLLTLRDRMGEGSAVTVVGAGPSGIELAAQLARRPDVARVRLVERGSRIAPALPPGAARRLTGILEQRGVEIVTGAHPHPHRAPDLTVVATGLRPAPLAAAPPLGGPDGIPVRATLQHRDHDHVYAAGDCADFLPRALPRVGVHGVRQGPVLLASLVTRRTGVRLPSYRPQRHALAVLDLGDTGLAVRGRWWWSGRWALRLKRWIDRRWLARYR